MWKKKKKKKKQLGETRYEGSCQSKFHSFHAMKFDYTDQKISFFTATCHGRASWHHYRAEWKTNKSITHLKRPMSTCLDFNRFCKFWQNETENENTYSKRLAKVFSKVFVFYIHPQVNCFISKQRQLITPAPMLWSKKWKIENGH